MCDTNYGHVGEIHFQAMLRVLGRRYLSVLLGELANNFHQLVRISRDTNMAK